MKIRLPAIFLALLLIFCGCALAGRTGSPKEEDYQRLKSLRTAQANEIILLDVKSPVRLGEKGGLAIQGKAGTRYTVTAVYNHTGRTLTTTAGRIAGPDGLAGRNIIFFSVGKMASLLGSSIYTFAMGLYVLRLTGSALSFATTLDSGMLGIIQGSIPAGAIVGAILVKKGRRSLDWMKHLPLISCILAVCIMLTGIPIIFTVAFHSNTILLLFYCPIMAILGITISLIDIPLLSMLQLELPENFRGRVLSLGMSLVKAASPLALLASGWSLKFLPPYVSVFSGGICLLLLARTKR